MRIPKSITLMGHEITIERGNTMEDDEAYGFAVYDQNRIAVQAPKRGIDPSVLKQTYCHELTHFILHYMNEHKLKVDEKFVDQFGQLLYQALSSAKYK